MPTLAAYLAARVGVPFGPVSPIDSDLSLTVQADKVFQINGPTLALVHLEMESSSHLGLPARLLRYNVLLHYGTGLPVHSVLMLLRPKANASDQTGRYEVPDAGGAPYLTFAYHVVRVWEEPIDSFLRSGAGLGPLAMLTDEAATDHPRALDRICERVRQPDVFPALARDLIGSSFTLSGLRYNAPQMTDLYRSMDMTLEDSTTYQMLIEKGVAIGVTRGVAQGVAQGEVQGRKSEAVCMILRIGRKRFAVNPPDVEQRLKSVGDVERLERMADRILDAADWDDLLSTP